MAPAGWSLSMRGPAAILEPPEGDSAIALVDVRAPSADSAVAAAWRAYKPDAKWPLKVVNDKPDKDGWTESATYGYQTSPNEKRDVGADDASRRRRVDRGHLRHGAGRRREACRPGRPDLRRAPAQGVHPRVVRRKEGAPARRRADRRAEPVRRDRRQKSSGVPGVAIGLDRRTARWCSPAGSACASWATPRRSTATRSS